MEEKINWKTFYDKESEFKQFNPEVDAAEKERIQFVFSLLPRGKPKIILDAGCGDGYLCNTFFQKGVAQIIVGGDLSVSRLHLARKTVQKCKFVASEIINLPFKSNSFDIVTAVKVLEHLETPLEALHELQRVSKRYVLFTIPYQEVLQQVLCPYCLKIFHKDGHIQSFDEERVKELCRVSELEIIKMKVYISLRAFDLDGPLNWIPNRIREFIKRIFFKAHLVSGTDIGVLTLKKR